MRLQDDDTQEKNKHLERRQVPGSAERKQTGSNRFETLSKHTELTKNRNYVAVIARANFSPMGVSLAQEKSMKEF